MAACLQQLFSYYRVVVKIGSAVLIDRKTGLRTAWLDSLAADIAALQHAGTRVLIISSGAIALGRILLSFSSTSLRLEESQACAAVGQIELARAYADYLQTYGLRSGQVLLTLADTEKRKRYLKARAAVDTLLKCGVVPVINENDTVAANEVCYGDNDRLAARIATMIGADLLIILSDIDGLYTMPPHECSDAEFIPFIETITPEIERMAGVAASEFSRGGMKTKLDAGKIATNAGIAMVIASGQRFHPLKAIDNGERISFFCADNKPVNARKVWIAAHMDSAGSLMIDEGAVEALFAGKSLLAAGVVAVSGHFLRGEIVAVINRQGHEIARGLVGYNAAEVRKIAGHRSDALTGLLGYEIRSAIIHRNDMVVYFE
ncbi:MAG: glutamate 5-kinase [Candidatus Tokpelaia sp. JSC085]|nr:MAG: glutamate 5-kinase [Candidatus Tokpelaia sp. JSC085]